LGIPSRGQGRLAALGGPRRAPGHPAGRTGPFVAVPAPQRWRRVWRQANALQVAANRLGVGDHGEQLSVLLQRGQASPPPVVHRDIKPSNIMLASNGELVLSDPASGQRTGNLCFCSRGFSLHAGRQVKAHHRVKLEELARYILRPPIANNRLSCL